MAILPRIHSSRQHLTLQPVLQGEPEDANAEIAEGEAAEGIDPAKHGGANPAAAPADEGADADAPEERAEKETSKEKGKLPARHARSYDAAAQTRPEGKSHRVGKAKNHASREIPACGRYLF